MPWSKEQKALAVRACNSAGVGDEQRRMVLSGPAFENRAVHNGRITSTSPRLTNEDFEQFMVFAEHWSGGRITVGGQSGAGFSRGYWSKKAADADHRLRWLATDLARLLEGHGLLNPGDSVGGAGLAGWIRTRVTHGRTDKLEDLSRHELTALIDGLRAYARRNGANLKQKEPVAC